MKILVVVDAVADRLILEWILVGAGHIVSLAESCEQAVIRAKSEQPDLILMDVSMPELDGFATTRRLKSDLATKDIRVVFVTGKNQKADIAWGRMLGVEGFVAKPYTPELILAQVNV